MKLDENKKELIKKVLRILIQIVIIGYLIYQVYEIGLGNLVKSLPTKPTFYILYLFIYFSLPIAEIFIYRISWPLQWKAAFPIFIQKKVLNTDVVGYSGEFFLYSWAKNNLLIPSKEAWKTIKDNNILSSAASSMITLALLYYFITQGYINIQDYLSNINTGVVLAVIFGMIIVAIAIYQFRNYIISMSFRDAIKVFSLHAFRIVFINFIQILQWEVARPEVTLAVWFSLSAVQIISSRIPFLPSTDALFVTIALEVSGLVQVPRELLAGILTANLVLKRLLNVSTYLIASAYKKTVTIEKSELEIKDLDA
ncbi:MAG: hypothetical protein JJ971_12040 [Balneolaceae bacterium]|nr:hypothetical protein [Balneolaceae bacterium]MBO6547418.1 hypothetical protein [Balneolaceae bacterium]MBO6647635.1 hypothetical protein [Balneolaceae bacterium]